LIQFQDPSDCNLLASRDHACDIIFDVDINILWVFTPTQAGIAFLYTQFLTVNELRLIRIQPEWALSFTPYTFVWLLKITGCLRNPCQRPTPLALERRLGDFRTNVCRFPNCPLDCNQVPVMFVA
jgi:hypothetical protein